MQRRIVIIFLLLKYLSILTTVDYLNVSYILSLILRLCWREVPSFKIGGRLFKFLERALLYKGFWVWAACSIHTLKPLISKNWVCSLILLLIFEVYIKVLLSFSLQSGRKEVSNRMSESNEVRFQRRSWILLSN